MSNFGTTDFDYRVALGLVPGYETWNKFGYNDNVPIGTEVIASFGGTYTPLAAAETLSVVSTSVNDITAGTGATTVVISGVDNDFNHVTEVLAMNGTTPVITTNAFRGVSRVSIYLAGALKVNEGTITLTSTVSATTEAQLPAGQGTTQQAIYHTSATGTILMRSLLINCLKLSGGAAPKITVKAWVYSDVSKATYEVFRTEMDTTVENHLDLGQQIPFVVGPKSTIWFEATSDKAATSVALRFSFVEYDA